MINYHTSEARHEGILLVAAPRARQQRQTQRTSAARRLRIARTNVQAEMLWCIMMSQMKKWQQATNDTHEANPGGGGMKMKAEERFHANHGRKPATQG